MQEICGNAYEETIVQVGEDEYEPGDPEVTSLLKCKCGMLSLWWMKREYSFKDKNSVLEPSHCIFRNVSMSFSFEFKDLDISSELAKSLQQRLNETTKCLSINAWLAGIILMGSILEGVLLAVCMKNQATAGNSPHAAKEKNKVKPFGEWGLETLIEVAYGEKWIDISVRDYSKTIRRFRNFVHPQLQTEEDQVNEHTCMISWHVLQLALEQLSKLVKKKKNPS